MKIRREIGLTPSDEGIEALGSEGWENHDYIRWPERFNGQEMASEISFNSVKALKRSLRDAQICLNSRKRWGDDWPELAKVTLENIVQYLSEIEKEI